ncbi:MAG: TIGR04372 family glycosyltransferase [Nitrospirae bacterium]|nr:TIGR04372 family glycosyltransferase [Nitrospirota bacterium]
MRRLVPGKKLLCICLSYYKRHNWKLSLIWPDITVLFLPLQTGGFFFGRKFISTASLLYTETLVSFVFGFARLVNSAKAEIISYIEFRNSHLAPLAPESFIRSSAHLPFTTYNELLTYHITVDTTDVPKACLPNNIRTSIVKRLDSVCQLENKRYCGLYLRQKGASEDSYCTSVRVGSLLEEYLPAVDLLNKNGYQVLITGDVVCSKSVFNKFQGMLVDYYNLNIKKEYFQLFAGTDVDISICENGGGLPLPVINKIPILFMNHYPYLVTVSNAWVYYKTLRDADDNLIHYRKILEDNPYQHDYHIRNNYTLHNNTSDEILNAVRYFVEDVKDMSRLNKDANAVENTLPDYMHIKYIKSRISPAFLELFETHKPCCPSGNQLS